MRKLLGIVFLVLSLVLVVSCSTTALKENEAYTIRIIGLERDISTTKHGNIRTDEDCFSFLENSGFELGDIVEVSFLDKKMDIPLVPSYSSVPAGQAGLALRINDASNNPNDYLATLFMNAGDFMTTYGIAVKQTNDDNSWDWVACEGVSFPIEVEIRLKEKGGYLSQLALADLNKSNERSDYPELDDRGFANFRKVTTTGMGDCLYRSSSPLNDENGRAAYAMKAMEEAGVNVIVNLEEDESKALSRLPYDGSYYSKQKAVYILMNTDFIGKTNEGAICDTLRFMAENPGIYCIHCNLGKDRTGFVIALLELLMGADMDEVVSDYMVTYKNFYGLEEGSDQYSYLSDQITDELKANGISDTGALQEQTEQFLLGTGLSSDEISKLKSNLSVRF